MVKWFHEYVNIFSCVSQWCFRLLLCIWRKYFTVFLSLVSTARFLVFQWLLTGLVSSFYCFVPLYLVCVCVVVVSGVQLWPHNNVFKTLVIIPDGRSCLLPILLYKSLSTWTHWDCWRNSTFFALYINSGCGWGHCAQCPSYTSTEEHNKCLENYSTEGVVCHVPNISWNYKNESHFSTTSLFTLDLKLLLLTTTPRQRQSRVRVRVRVTLNQPLVVLL